MRLKLTRRSVNGLLLLTLLAGTGVLGAVRDNRYGGDLAWAANYTEGLRLARQTGRPLLLSFHTPGCGWCAKMDGETFTDPQVVQQSQRYVCVRLESDVDAQLVRQYAVEEYPMLLITDPRGVAVAHLPGYVAPDRLAPALDKLYPLASRPAPSAGKSAEGAFVPKSGRAGAEPVAL